MPSDAAGACLVEHGTEEAIQTASGSFLADHVVSHFPRTTGYVSSLFPATMSYLGFNGKEESEASAPSAKEIHSSEQETRRSEMRRRLTEELLTTEIASRDQGGVRDAADEIDVSARFAAENDELPTPCLRSPQPAASGASQKEDDGKTRQQRRRKPKRFSDSLREAERASSQLYRFPVTWSF